MTCLADTLQGPAGHLLEARGDERGEGPLAVGLGLDGADGEVGVDQLGGEGRGGPFVEHDTVVTGELALLGEVVAGGEAGAVDGDQLGAEGGALGRRVGGGEGALEVPPAGGHERHDLPLTLDHQAGGDALHAAGGEAGVHLLPGDLGDVVAVEAVEQAPGLLGVHQPHVELAGVGEGLADRGGGDLVEHHAVHRDVALGLQHLEQVPGDGLALAILISGEVEGVGVLEGPLQLTDERLLRVGHHVVGLEVVVGVDRQTGPRLLLDRRRELLHLAGEVPDVAHRRQDHRSISPTAGRAEELRDLLGLGG